MKTLAAILALFTLLGDAHAWDFRDAKRVHDPSRILQCDGGFWCYCTGFGVRSMRSTNLVDWEFAAPVFPAAPAWTYEFSGERGNYFWAADAVKVGGRYLLFYSVSTFGKNISAIGLASNPTLNPSATNFLWRDDGIVVRSQRTNDFNTIDPAPFLDSDGKLWLTFGSFWSGIKLVELDPATGKKISPDAPLHSLAWNAKIEAPYLHKRGTNYFLFVNWGLCCQSNRSTYEIRVGRSGKVAGPYLDRDGADMARGGGTLLLGTRGRFIGPGHAGIAEVGGEDWLSFHYYDGDNAGRPRLALRKLKWGDDGWPVVTDIAPGASVKSP